MDQYTFAKDEVITIAKFRSERGWPEIPGGPHLVVDNDLRKLHTRLIVRAHEFLRDLEAETKTGGLRFQWRVHEAWRSVERQLFLYRNYNPEPNLRTPKPPQSKHQPWSSAHQYGMAIDLQPHYPVPHIGMRPIRDEWTTVRNIAAKHGLVAPDDEHEGHLEDARWRDWCKNFRYPDYLDTIPVSFATGDRQRVPRLK